MQIQSCNWSNNNPTTSTDIKKKLTTTIIQQRTHNLNESTKTHLKQGSYNFNIHTKPNLPPQKQQQMLNFINELRRIQKNKLTTSKDIKKRNNKLTSHKHTKTTN